VTLVRRIADARAVGDRERLKQVFHNLLVNAMEATPHGGVVTVSCHRGADDPDATVTIADTGRGIPTGTLEKVFEPFFTTKEAGTGLGLSIVRQIVERHGGAIDLESTEGRGTHGAREGDRLVEHGVGARGADRRARDAQRGSSPRGEGAASPRSAASRASAAGMLRSPLAVGGTSASGFISVMPEFACGKAISRVRTVVVSWYEPQRR
jgi:hypothetical protein